MLPRDIFPKASPHFLNGTKAAGKEPRPLTNGTTTGTTRWPFLQAMQQLWRKNWDVGLHAESRGLTWLFFLQFRSFAKGAEVLLQSATMIVDYDRRAPSGVSSILFRSRESKTYIIEVAGLLIVRLTQLIKPGSYLEYRR